MTSMAERARPWRCFWAVPLPSDLRDVLASHVAELRTVPGVEDNWRFTEPESWHLTLAFIGAVEPAAVGPMVRRVAAAVQDHARFEAVGTGLGGFPSGRLARVLWFGVDADAPLADLARDVRGATGLDDEQAWRPHVTIARSRDRHGAQLPRSATQPPTGIIPATEVVLFRSHLGSGPARYETLAQLALGAPAMALPR
jgi:2'-5' RNA ligase